MYDYIGYLKKFGFELNQNAMDFKFEIKIDNKKIKKKNFFIKKYKKKYLYWSIQNMEYYTDLAT